MSIKINGVHHIALTVSDTARSQAFYEEVLGFNKVADFGPRVIMVRDNLMLGMGPAPDSSQAPAGDHFNPNRMGLDHLSFAVDSRDELERAKQLFDERGIEHKNVKELEPFGLVVLAFRDPDGIALELTAPLNQG